LVISWGYLEVSKDHVTVLAETAEAAEGIDIARAQLAQKKAEETLSKGDLEQHQFQKYQLKLERAMIRVQAAQKPNETTH
jgi:F-type H+-transporting ATPase subunit epsilon